MFRLRLDDRTHDDMDKIFLFQQSSSCKYHCCSSSQPCQNGTRCQATCTEKAKKLRCDFATEGRNEERGEVLTGNGGLLAKNIFGVILLNSSKTLLCPNSSLSSKSILGRLSTGARTSSSLNFCDMTEVSDIHLQVQSGNLIQSQRMFIFEKCIVIGQLVRTKLDYDVSTIDSHAHFIL